MTTNPLLLASRQGDRGYHAMQAGAANRSDAMGGVKSA